MRRAVFVFLVSVVAVVSRRPDVLFHAQFWAEDGKFWYADAYNLGVIEPFLHPAAGYFQTLPRLAALMAQPFPMTLAPLLMNCLGIGIQILPVLFLLSSRCRNLGSLAGRALFVFFYLALPNSQEMHVNITNQQWRLAFLTLLIVFAEPGKTALWDAFDYAAIVLCGLTGPFIVFIAPIAAIFYLMESRTRRRWWLTVLCGCGALVEFLSVWIAGGSERIANAVRAASPQLLIQILAKQVFLAVLIGRRGVGDFSFASTGGMLLAAFVVLAGLAIEIYVLWKAPLPWKCLLVFSTMILASSLAWPMTSSPQWPALLQSGGVRYWFFSLLAFTACLVWLLERQNPAWLRRAGAALLIVTMVGVVQDWGHPRPVDLKFAAYVENFRAAPAGTTFKIPLNPVGWYMELMKR